MKGPTDLQCKLWISTTISLIVTGNKAKLLQNGLGIYLKGVALGTGMFSAMFDPILAK